MIIIKRPHNLQGNYGRVNNLFSNFSEVDGDHIARTRLHLPHTPIRVVRVFNKHAWLKNMMGHRFSPLFTAPEAELSKEPDLPALIAARICHDLISPLGAIGNGIELLQMASAPSGGPEIDLVRASVQQAQTRIRLFRLAFGSFRSDQMIGTEELTGLLRDYAATARFDLNWMPDSVKPKAIIQLGLLGLLCLETALPYGGRVVVMETETTLELSARSDTFKREDRLWDALTGRSAWPDDLQAARVQFPLLQRAISEQAMTLELRPADDGLDLRIIAA